MTQFYVTTIYTINTVKRLCVCVCPETPPRLSKLSKPNFNIKCPIYGGVLLSIFHFDGGKGKNFVAKKLISITNLI